MDPIGLSIQDAGRALAGEKKPISRATIYRMMSRGELDGRKIGGRRVVTVESIRARMEAAA